MNFPVTRWTLIAHLGDEEKAGAAMDQLCAAYWQPIHAYFVQAGCSRFQSQDLTQDFLEGVVRKRLLERADPVAGKLRSWLVAALRNFLANAQRHDNRQKRVASTTALPLDHEEVLPELRGLAASNLTPDEAFDRAWITVLLRRVLDGLAQQYKGAGKEAEYQALLPWLLDEGGSHQAKAALHAGMTITQFRVQLHRLKGRYRELLRREVTATLEDKENYEEELAYLFRIVGLPV